MPIIVTDPVPPVLGPGLLIGAQSDIVGPIPGDWQWIIHIRRRGSEDDSINLRGPIRTDLDHRAFVTIGQNTGGWTTQVSSLQGIASNSEATVTVELTTSTGVVEDSGTSDAYTWDSTTNLWTLVEQAAAGGFTADDRALVTDTERRSQVLGEPLDLVLSTASGFVTSTLAQLFSRTTLDQLTLSEVTSGETCEPVRALVSTWATAVIVRVTTIGEDLVPRTPDANWYFPDLAVLRIFRGGDLQYRRGIHTPTFMVDQPWQWSWQFLNELQVLGNPPDITIAVDWRPGCCGQVFLMSLP